METVILPPLLNREFKLPEDGLFQFAPLGEYPILDPVTKNRVVQVVDAEAVRLMAADIAKEKTRSNWPGLLVDRDHFSFDASKESRAAGWANDAQARPDGLFGPIRFTNSGKADVEGGEFRFLSPVFDRKSAVPLGGGRFRVTRLLGLALTNTPNIRNIQALTNRAEEFHGREATTEETNQGNTMKDRLIQLFKMPAASTEDELFAKATALLNRASEADTLQGNVTKLTADHDALKNRHTTLLNTAVTTKLDEFKGVITEESKEAWKNRLTSDFDGTVALLNGIKKPAGDGKKTPLHKGDKPVADTTGGEHPFLNRVTELRTADPKLGESAAIMKAAEKDPALYETYRASLTGNDE